MQEKQLAELKDKLEKMKMLQYRAEAKLEELQKRKQEILEEIASLQVDPKKLEQEITAKEREIADLLQKARELMPLEILDKCRV